MRQTSGEIATLGCVCVWSHALGYYVSNPTPSEPQTRLLPLSCPPPTYFFCLLLEPTLAKLKGIRGGREPDFMVFACVQTCVHMYVMHMCTCACRLENNLGCFSGFKHWSGACQGGSGSACPHFFRAGIQTPAFTPRFFTWVLRIEVSARQALF